MGITSDLGFELLVAVCASFIALATLCDKIDEADWTRSCHLHGTSPRQRTA